MVPGLSPFKKPLAGARDGTDDEAKEGSTVSEHKWVKTSKAEPVKCERCGTFYAQAEMGEECPEPDGRLIRPKPQTGAHIPLDIKGSS